MKCNLCGRDDLTAQELAVHNKYFHVKKPKDEVQIMTSSVCPDCGSQLSMQEGCTGCRYCGYSKCA